MHSPLFLHLINIEFLRLIVLIIIIRQVQVCLVGVLATAVEAHQFWRRKLVLKRGLGVEMVMIFVARIKIVIGRGPLDRLIAHYLLLGRLEDDGYLVGQVRL